MIKDYEGKACLASQSKQSQTNPISSVGASELRREGVRFQMEKSDLRGLPQIHNLLLKSWVRGSERRVTGRQ